MAGFIYYKPGHQQPSVSMAQLKEWGLEHAFDSPPECRSVKMGEHGVGVLMNAPARMGGLVAGYYPDAQEWRKIPGSDCLVGYYKEHPPTVEDIARKKMVRGYTIRLNDDQTYSIPSVVHVVDGQQVNKLPCHLDVDDDMKICKGAPLDEYQFLWDLAKPYIDKFLVPPGEEDTDATIESEQVLEDAITLLQVNYHIGLGEILLTDVFPEEVLGMPLELVLCSIDWPTWIAWWADLKKTKHQADTAGSNSYAGNGASHQATAPLQQTS